MKIMAGKSIFQTTDRHGCSSCPPPRFPPCSSSLTAHTYRNARRLPIFTAHRSSHTPPPPPTDTVNISPIRRHTSRSSSSSSSTPTTRIQSSPSSASSIDLPYNPNDPTPFFLSQRMKTMIRQIAAFGLPALMVPLADPIMSLIDTIALGQLTQSHLQLAALGPCSLLFNFAFYSFTALSVATVSLVAERLRQHRDAGPALSTSLFLGACGGVVVATIFLALGPQLLAATGCDPALVATSWQYLRIRAFAAPAAIITQVAQAGLLGQRDSKTPFKIVLISILVSIVGDVWLIGGMGWGVQGAAGTTVAAQFLSALLLLHALQRSRVPPPIELPSREEIRALMVTASTLGIYYIAKTTSYLFLQATATRLPAMLLAAHQPVWQLWGLASFSNTPLEQASLAFIPAAQSPREKKELISTLIGLGGVAGVVCSLIAHGIPGLFPSLLTADSALWPHMQSVWVPGSLALLGCGIDVSSTGVLLACKDASYVARSMIVSGSALVLFLWSRGVYSGGAVRMGHVWWGVAVFFAVRAAQSFPRALAKYMEAASGEGDSSSGSGGEKTKGEDDVVVPSVEVAEGLNVNAT